MNCRASAGVRFPISDRLGLATPILQLPPDSILSPDWLIDAQVPLAGDDFFRFSDIPSYISLAQHHGLPTRLLDWTHDPSKPHFLLRRRSQAARPGRT